MAASMDQATYLDPILRLARKLRIPTEGPEVWNAKYLAAATRRDLLVVLLTPSPNSHRAIGDQMVQASETLQYVDKCLERFSNGLRNIENTAVFDIYPLRTDLERREDRRQRGTWLEEECDRLSYKAFEESVRAFRPRVVLVCHCAPGDGSYFSRVFTSKMGEVMSNAPQSFTNQILGYNMTVVKAFHPTNFLDYRNQNEEEKLRRRKKFDWCFEEAISLLDR